MLNLAIIITILMNRKIVAVWISLAMLFGIVIILVDIAQIVRAPMVIYVDDVPGEGPDNPKENYTSIQDAIDNATVGDTVFVYNGTYYENVIVYVTINLTGEDWNTTIIDGQWNGDVIRVEADYVNITGFTVKRSGNQSSSPYDSGIELDTMQTMITW
jgi:nitrous oxidase accessory protein NosD